MPRESEVTSCTTTWAAGERCPHCNSKRFPLQVCGCRYRWCKPGLRICPECARGHRMAGELMERHLERGREKALRGVPSILRADVAAKRRLEAERALVDLLDDIARSDQREITAEDILLALAEDL